MRWNMTRDVLAFVKRLFSKERCRSHQHVSATSINPLFHVLLVICDVISIPLAYFEISGPLEI